LLTLVSNQHNSVSHITVGVGATVELSYPGLDMYLPHILARLDEGKNNITATVLRNNSTAAKVTTKPVANVSTSSTSPTIVKPGIYVDNSTQATTSTSATTKAATKTSKTTTASTATVEVPEIKSEQTVVVETPAEAAAKKA
jgi:hypothetical protein